MPVVPRLEGPQVKQAPLSGARVITDAPIEAFGGGKVVSGPAAAAEKTLGIAAKIFEEEKKKADDVAVTDARSQLTMAEDFIRDKVSKRKGKDAFAAAQEAEEEFAKLSGDIEKGLSSDRQKRMFAQAKQSTWGNINRSTNAHMAAEGRVYDNESTESLIKNEADAAIANYQDTERRDLSISTTWAAKTDYARRNGKSEAWLNEQGSAAESRIHVGVMNRMLENGNDLEAKAYYEREKDFFFGDDRTRVEAVMAKGSLRGESRRQSESIIGSTKTMTEALEKARGISDASVSDATVDRIRGFYAEKKAADAADTESRFKSVVQTIQQTKSMDSIPAATLATFDDGELERLKKFTRSTKQGIEPVTDRETYYGLMTLASSPQTRDAFMRINLFDPKYAGNLDNSDFQEMTKLQAGVRAKEPATQKALDGSQSKKQVIDSVLSEFKYDPTPKDKSTAATQIAAFRTAVDQAEAAEKQKTGKPNLTNEEVRRIARGLMVETVTEKGTLWDTKKRAFEIKPTDVPSSDRAEIVRELQKRRKPVTEAGIVDLYRRGLESGR